MASEKIPNPPARPAAKKKLHTQPAKPVKKSKPAPAPSKAKTIQLSQSTRKHGESFDSRVRNVIDGTARVVERKERDPFAMPSLDDMLPSLDAAMPTLSGGGFLDPIEQAASDLRTFGPELDDDPVRDRPDLSFEDAETARLADLHQGFRDRMKAESARRELATDPEFWLCIVFQDRNQKDQFLTQAGWLDLGDKYIDGERLADLIDVPIDKSQITYNIGGADPKLAALVDIDPGFDIETKKPIPERKRR